MNTFQHIAPLVGSSDWDHDGAWWLVFPLFWLAVLGTAAWFVVHTLRRAHPSGIERARGILAERYARGEVSGEEYRERLDELSRHA
jgi:putative membrane protein